MSTYNINIDNSDNPEMVIATVGFGEPADNDIIVVDASAVADTVASKIAGKAVLVNGRASLPVAFAMAHSWAHMCKAIAIFDPKLGGYVVSITHSPLYKLGQIVHQ